MPEERNKGALKATLDFIELQANGVLELRNQQLDLRDEQSDLQDRVAALRAQLLAAEEVVRLGEQLSANKALCALGSDAGEADALEQDKSGKKDCSTSDIAGSKAAC